MVDGYFVTYKIKINENFQHSDYLYQKIFRAIYGYTQVVTKSNGKKYVYHRPGVLSFYPYIKKGKNEVIVTKEGFSKLILFLNTGKNPAHRWDKKGNWTGTYDMSEIELKKEDVEKAIIKMIKNIYVLDEKGYNKKLIEILEEVDNNKFFEKYLLKNYLKIINQIKSNPWYSISLNNKFINKFDILSKQLEQKI